MSTAANRLLAPPDFDCNPKSFFRPDLVRLYSKKMELLRRDAFLLTPVPRFDLQGRRLLQVNRKHYLGDVGLRNGIIGYRETDIGGVLENLVFLELRRRGCTVTVGESTLSTPSTSSVIAWFGDGNLLADLCRRRIGGRGYRRPRRELEARQAHGPSRQHRHHVEVPHQRPWASSLVQLAQEWNC